MRSTVPTFTSFTPALSDGIDTTTTAYNLDCGCKVRISHRDRSAAAATFISSCPDGHSQDTTLLLIDRALDLHNS